MKEIRVYGCPECPFLVTYSDGGFPDDYECDLIEFLKIKKGIRANNNGIIKNPQVTPKWCPMRKEEEIIFQFREMSDLVFLQGIVEKLKTMYKTDVYLDDVYNQFYFEYEKGKRLDVQSGEKGETFWVSAENMSMQCKKDELLVCISYIILEKKKNDNRRSNP